MRRLFRFIALAACLAAFPADAQDVKSTASRRAHIPMTSRPRPTETSGTRPSNRGHWVFSIPRPARFAKCRLAKDPALTVSSRVRTAPHR